MNICGKKLIGKWEFLFAISKYFFGIYFKFFNKNQDGYKENVNLPAWLIQQFEFKSKANSKPLKCHVKLLLLFLMNQTARKKVFSISILTSNFNKNRSSKIMFIV